MAKKRRGCLTEVCTDGLVEWDENPGEWEYIERCACDGALVLQTGLAERCRGDNTRGLLFKDAVECEREVGPCLRTIPGGIDGIGGTRGTSGVGGTLNCKDVTNR